MVKSNSLCNTEKLESRELYCIINFSHISKPTSQRYFEKKVWFKRIRLEGKLYTPTKSYNKHVFKIVQHKIINIIYLKEKRFVFGLSTISFCSFCKSFDENITSFFCQKLKDNTTLLPVTPQVVICGFLETTSNLI